MYPDLYKRLNLRPEDLTAYNSPLVSFEGNIVISKGQIRLPIQTGSKMMEVDFIVVDAYSPYIAIVARPQFHALGTVSSTLHQKVKYLLGGQVKKIVRSQSMARQCLLAAISHRPEAKSSTFAERGSQQSKTPTLLDNGSAEEAKCEDLERVVVGDDPEKFFQVGAQLPPQEREELIEFLRKMLMFLHGTLMKLCGWIQTSSAII